MPQFKCPRCLRQAERKTSSVSRRDNRTAICENCGTEEAIFDMMVTRLPLRRLIPKILRERERRMLKHLDRNGG